MCERNLLPGVEVSDTLVSCSVRRMSGQEGVSSGWLAFHLHVECTCWLTRRSQALPVLVSVTAREALTTLIFL